MKDKNRIVLYNCKLKKQQKTSFLGEWEQLDIFRGSQSFFKGKGENWEKYVLFCI